MSKIFISAIQKKFKQMSETGKLFRVSLTGHDLWNIYINSFPKKYNPIFRDPSSSEKTCNNCRNFINRYGNIVSINENYEIDTMFDIKADEEHEKTVKVMSEAIKASPIQDIFVETFYELNSLPYESCKKTNQKFQLGVDKNVKKYTKEEAQKFGVVDSETVYTFEHLHVHVDKEFIDFSGSSVQSVMAPYRDAKNVLKRALDEIPLDTLNLVRDLIMQDSLLDGRTHLSKVESMIKLKGEYDAAASSIRDNWCWIRSYKFPLAKFRNELIGTLCVELAEGKEINDACQTWNRRVDPKNYMKATAPITKKQIQEAKEFVEQNGYAESFNRRHATLEDINISEILHANSGDGKIKNASIFDSVKSTSTRHKRSEFEGVEEVAIDKFMKDILPTCTSVEAYFDNKHTQNLVSLTTSVEKESKPIFKWSNNFSWTFNGNLAGKSEIKEMVKSAGGKIDGVLRFSIIWNEDGKDILDFDAHAVEPDKHKIYFGDKGPSMMSGRLDVDKIRPKETGVENIVWSHKNRMKDGEYLFSIHNFDGGQNKGFRAEIEFDGNIYSYEYTTPVSNTKNIAKVTLKNGTFTIEHLIPESAISSKEEYGISTNEFHKVNLICLTPNHWGQNNVGNKYFLFMLDGCKNPNAMRSFHNENLLPELLNHRKVFEVLGNTSMIQSTDKQLSGLGFNATVRDSLLVKLQGTHKRMIKIIF